VIYNATDSSILVRDSSIERGHNLVFHKNRIIVNDTRGMAVSIFDLDGALVKRIRLLDFPEIAAIHKDAASSTEEVRSIFVRGLWFTVSGRALVGFSPASIAEIDLEGNQLLDLYQYSHNVAVSIHGILVWE
jgi:hypothetical protein